MVKIENIDGNIWNKDLVLLELLKYFQNRRSNYDVSTNGEGVCLQSSGIEAIVLSAIQQSGIDTNAVTISNGNLLKSSSILPEKTVNNLFELKLYQNFDCNPGKNITKHFGNFIGRGNWQRLWIASELFRTYSNKTIQSYHWEINHDYHSNHLGFEFLLNYTKDYSLLNSVLNFLKTCPKKITEHKEYPILEDKSHFIRSQYESIFIDVVCETYYSGNVFFLTEKTWRPIEQMTPFIIQGPQFFLKNLKQLGFKTFDQWWPEVYDESSFYCKPEQILGLIDNISSWSVEKCKKVYEEMRPILEHNRQTLKRLTWDQIESVKFFDTESNMP